MPRHLNQRIYVAGHRGMVGAAIVRALRRNGATDIVTRTRAELDLTEQSKVRAFFESERIEEVYLAAAHVGGIHANRTYPAEFIHQNLMIAANVIHQAWCSGVQKLLFLGSSCVYPRLAPQPIPEEALLTAPLEPTNEPYAIAKIAGIKLCESYNRQYGTDFRSVMPTNLYGPGDNYHPENSHVIPALIRRFVEARLQGANKVTVWGSGTPRREFLHVDDMADACLHVMALPRDQYQANTTPMRSHLNVGVGMDISIAELARLISQAADFQGSIEFDADQPDGTPRKLMDSGRLASLGWRPKIALRDGISATCAQFERQEMTARK